MSALVVNADARDLSFLAGDSVDLVVTSPPYWAQRSYREDGEHYEGQIGSEPHPQLWLEAMWGCAREWWRVLKPSGSCFIDLGDKRAGSGGHNNSGLSPPRTGEFATRKHNQEAPRLVATRRNAPDRYQQAHFGRPKSRQLLPERFAIGMEDGLGDPEGIGWIVRQVIVWEKPNCLSGGTQLYAKVKGRPTSIKVHDLCRAYRPEDVQLWNGQRWTQVLWWQPTGRHPDAVASYKAIRTAREHGQEPVVGGDIEIEFRSGERVGCTREHRWPTQRGLVPAADLRVGDVVATTPLPDGEVFPEALDDEMVGWFVGLYIAEGSHSERTIQIAGHSYELERFKRLQTLAEAFHGTCVVHLTGPNKATINLTGQLLEAILGTYIGGRTAKDKHLAPKCWQRSNRFLRSVLEGYLSGDGHWRGDANRWTVGFTDNDYLASDLRTLGARLNLSVRLKRVTHTGFGKEWPGWGGHITAPYRRRAPDSEVVAIRQSRARQFWDIGVEDDPHLFALASGVLTHNSLPESVTDRTRDNFEVVYHFTKSERYYSAVDEIREPQSDHYGMERRGITSRNGGSIERADGDGRGSFEIASGGREYNPLGKLPGSVWRIASEPLAIPEWAKARYNLPDHFAAFPSELPRRLILGWSPPPSRPAVVLDPFCGTGTTLGVAQVLGRNAVGVELSEDYCRLAWWRISQPSQWAKATTRSWAEAQGTLL